MQDIVDAGGGADRHDNIGHGKGSAEPLVQIVRHGLPRFLKTGIIHVSVQVKRVLIAQQTDSGLIDAGRCRYARVSEAEIVYILCPVLLRKLSAFLKHLSDC